VAFTALEEKILKTLASLGGDRRVSVEELADIVECKPETIYTRLHRNEEFRETFKAVLKNSLVGEIPAVLQSFVDIAKQGSFKHQKLFLELVGMYQEKQQIQADIRSVTTEIPFKDDQERDSFLQATLSGLKARLEKGGK